MIEKAWESHPAYGHRRLTIHLGIGKDRIIRVMRMFKMRPPNRPKAKPEKPNDQNQPASVYPNLIKTFCPTAPHVVWVADFTNIPFQHHFLYLATVLDRYSREVLGWQVLTVHTTRLIRRAFEDALHRTGKIPLFHHSDQGSEYKELRTYKKWKASVLSCP